MNFSRRAFVASSLAGLAASGVAVSRAARAADAPVPNAGSEMALSLAVLRNVPGALIVVANEQGIFQKKGVALTVPGKFLSGGGPELLPAVAAGNADLGMIGDSPAILALGRDALPLQIVAAVSDTSRVFSIVAAPEIGSLADLAGKRVGLPFGTAFEYFLARALDKAGMKETDVKLVNLTQAQAQPAFVAGRIDAVLPDTFGRSALLKARPEAKVVFSSEDGFAGRAGAGSSFRQFNVFVAGSQAVGAKHGPIRAFLRTYYQDVAPLLAQRAGSGPTIAKMAAFLNGAAKNAVTEDDLARQVDLSGFPSLPQAQQWQKNDLLAALDAQAEFWLQTGRIKVKPDFKRMINEGLLS